MKRPRRSDEQTQRDHTAVLEERHDHARREVEKWGPQVVGLAVEVGRNKNDLAGQRERVVEVVEELATPQRMPSNSREVAAVALDGRGGGLDLRQRRGTTMAECAWLRKRLKKMVQLPLQQSS